MNKFKHIICEKTITNIYEYVCKYCGESLVFDSISYEFIPYLNIFKECISNEEKIIKDLLE